MATQSSSDTYFLKMEADLESVKVGITAYETKIAQLEKDISAAEKAGQDALDKAKQEAIEELKKSIKNVKGYSQNTAEEAFELEKWGATASKIAENPEETPFKLMNKTLGKSGYYTFEDRVVSADRVFSDWLESVRGQSKEQAKKEQAVIEFFLGPKQSLSIAEAFPQYFNEFHYQGDQSKLIDFWYSPDAWIGVSEAYYQEAAWRRSVLSELQGKLISLEWKLYKIQNSPDHELPNAKQIEYLQTKLQELQNKKEEMEKRLEEYQKNYDKAYNDFLARGATEENSDAVGHDMAAAKDIAAQQKAAENEPLSPRGPASGGFRGAITPTLDQYPDTDALRGIGGKTQTPVRDTALGTVHAYVNSPSLWAGPLFGAILSQIKTNATQENISEALQTYPELAMLSPDELARVNKFMLQGNSFQDALKFALQIKGMPAEFDLLTNIEKDQVKVLIGKGVSPTEAIKNVLTIQHVSGSASQVSETSQGRELRGVALPTSSKKPAEEQEQSKFKSKQTEETLERINKTTVKTPNYFSRFGGGILAQIRNAQFFQATGNRSQQSTASGAKESVGAAIGLLGGGLKLAASKALDLAAKAAGPVVYAAKKVIDRVLALIPNEWKKNFKDFLLGAGSGLYILITRLISSLFGGATTVLSNLFGGGSAATASAAALPASVAYGGSGGIGGTSLFGTSGAAAAGGGGASGFGILSGGAAPVVLAVGTTAAVSLITIVGTAAAFLGQPQGDHLDTEVKVSFEVTKKASPKTDFPEYTVGPQEVTYTIDLQASEDITIESATDRQTLYGKNGREEELGSTELVFTPIELKKGEKKSFTVQDYPNLKLTAVGEKFKDTAVVNVVSITANTPEGPQTLTALETVTFGEPPLDQPYGYPTIGTIKSIDGGLIDLDGDGIGDRAHCGTFLYSNGAFPDEDRHCEPGGLDISVLGEVKSTVKGTVIKAGFDEGNGKRTYLDNGVETPCPNVTLTSKYTCYGLGGYVYIQDVTGRFVAAYLHLNTPTVTSGQSVERGTPIGTIYPKSDLPTATGPHVHYQVLQNGANMNFVNYLGPCKQGKLLPTEPALEIDAQVEVAGPFDCN